MTTKQMLHSSIEHLYGPEDVPYVGNDELVVVCLVRDGRPWVKSFVEHYFSLGVKHTVFLDNGSSDGTVEVLKNYDNVTVIHSRLPYKEYKYLFKQYLIERFGKKDRWCLCVDIDELFDYPYSDVIGLGSFLGYLNSKSYTAVAAQMLDMFPEDPLSDQANSPDEPLKERHRFYDISNIRRRSIRANPDLRNNNILESSEIEWFSYGIRHTLFGTVPYLTKHPLVFCDGGVKPIDGSSHHVANARVADLTCVLFHYKFLDYFREQAARAVREANYSDDSSEYKKYLEVLDKSPSLQVKRETSKEIASVNDLLENGFLVVSDDYVSWVDAEEEKSLLLQAPQNEPRGSAEAFLESRRRERAMTLKAQRHEQRMQSHEQRMQRHEQKIQSHEQKIQSHKKRIESHEQRTQRRLQRLEQRRQRKLQRLEQQVRDRGRMIRKLERDQQRLERRVGRLEQRLESMQASLIWRLEKVLHRIKARILSLRRSSP